MSKCVNCGTLTGIHGFSFNSQGRYEDEFVLDPEFEPYFSNEPLPWKLVKDVTDNPLLTLYHYEREE